MSDRLVSGPVRLIWWSDTYWPRIGGIEVLGAQSLPRLGERGFEVVVVTSQHDNTTRADEMHDGVSIRRFPFHKALRMGRRDLWTSIIHDIHTLKIQFRPHVVHINAPSPSSMFHLLTEKGSGWKTVTAIHTSFPESSKEDESLTRRLLGQSAWVVANSLAMLNDSLRIAPEISGRSSVIYNGVEDPGLKSSALSFDPPVIVCIARLVRKKGIDVAIRAFSMVHQKQPHVRMVIAGDGPGREHLEALAAELGLSEAIDFRGWVEPEKIATLIDEATQVWVPSRATEPFGLVAVEAMQMARPVIVTDQGGLPEVVENERSGFVIAADDAPALAMAGLRILAQPELAEEMGKAGRERARKLFGMESHVDQYENLYRRIVGTSTR